MVEWIEALLHGGNGWAFETHDGCVRLVVLLLIESHCSAAFVILKFEADVKAKFYDRQKVFPCPEDKKICDSLTQFNAKHLQKKWRSQMFCLALGSKNNVENEAWKHSTFRLGLP